MKSRASFKSHPIHPILVSFPIVFFSATFFFDCLFMFLENDGFFITAHFLHIGGLITAILAAIPGIIDYIFTVPPHSSAKKRAGKHGTLNGLMLVVFLIAFFLKDTTVSVFYILALEILGLGLMMTAGWMGGTLVHRNFIGVEGRFANAGKWKEEFCEHTSGLVQAASVKELMTDQMKLLHVDGKRVVLARSETSFVAFDDRCSHRGASLADGTMICGTVQCPWHGSQFSVVDGTVKAGPAKEDIKTYPVTVRDEKVYIDITKTN